MLLQMAGLVGTGALSDWENSFLRNVLARTDQGKRTSILTSDQVEKVQEIYERRIAS